MTIKQYIDSIKSAINNANTPDEYRALTFKLKYARAYSCGDMAITKLRDTMIVHEICKTYDRDAQISILFNQNTAPAEYNAYQEYRKACKALVDARLATVRETVLREMGA